MKELIPAKLWGPFTDAGYACFSFDYRGFGTSDGERGVRNALHPIDEARSLYAHAREPKELIEIPDGHHLDWIEPGHPLYLATIPRIVNWFRQHLPAGSAPPWHSPRDRSGAPVDSSDS